MVPVDVVALHLDDQYARIGDLEAVEGTVVTRFAVAENHRKDHALQYR